MNELDIVDRLSIHRTMSQYLTIDQLIFTLNCDRSAAKSEILRLRTELSELRTKAEAQAVPVALRYQRNDEIWTHVYYSQASCEYLSKKGIRYELLYTVPPEQAARVPDDDDTIRERDCYHDWADKLADAIAEFIGADIGEHSNANNPWQNALDALDEYEPQQATSVPDEKPNPDWRTTNPTDYPFEMAYVKGWNECRAVMLAAASSPTGLGNPEAPKPNDKCTFVIPDSSMTKIRYIFVDGEMVYENLEPEQ